MRCALRALRANLVQYVLPVRCFVHVDDLLRLPNARHVHFTDVRRNECVAVGTFSCAPNAPLRPRITNGATVFAMDSHIK